VHDLHVCGFGAGEHDDTISNSRYWHFRIVGIGNVSFAGMRAQNNRSVLWRTLAFIFGLPGTIVTFFAVPEGSDRAYGIDLPRKGRP
jgi:hypothetical protein